MLKLKFNFTWNGFVMDADYSDEHSMIGSVASDSCMYFFTKTDEGYELAHCINAPSI